MVIIAALLIVTYCAILFGFILHQFLVKEIGELFVAKDKEAKISQVRVIPHWVQHKKTLSITKYEFHEHFRHLSKFKAKEFKRRELDLRAKLEVAIATLHEDTHDPVKQGEVSRLAMAMDEIENRKARGATIRARIKWQVVGDKCSA